VRMLLFADLQDFNWERKLKN